MPTATRRLLFTHAGCLLIFWTGTSAVALLTFLAGYLVRMLGVSLAYHRYFSHAAFRTGRGFQLVLALLGATSGQRGPLWWASRHRHHHRHSDTASDIHSPVAHSLWWSHLGWLATDRYLSTDMSEVPDLARYPELVLLDRHYALVPLGSLVLLFCLGSWLSVAHPGLHTSGLQLVAWGFFMATVAACHATCAVNSLGHRFGSAPHPTGDASRNAAWLALLTLGDGWHNNHHRFPGAARHGHTPLELDPTWLVLRGLAIAGLVWDLRSLPDRTPGR